jgi:hypothetical protein
MGDAVTEIARGPVLQRISARAVRRLDSAGAALGMAAAWAWVGGPDAALGPLCAAPGPANVAGLWGGHGPLIGGMLAGWLLAAGAVAAARRTPPDAPRRIAASTLCLCGMLAGMEIACLVAASGPAVGGLGCLLEMLAGMIVGEILVDEALAVWTRRHASPVGASGPLRQAGHP